MYLTPRINGNYKISDNLIEVMDNNPNNMYLNKDKVSKYKDARAIYYCKTKDYSRNYDFKPIGDYYYTYIGSMNCEEAYIVVKEY